MFQLHIGALIHWSIKSVNFNGNVRMNFLFSKSWLQIIATLVLVNFDWTDIYTHVWYARWAKYRLGLHSLMPHMTHWIDISEGQSSLMSKNIISTTKISSSPHIQSVLITHQSKSFQVHNYFLYHISICSLLLKFFFKKNIFSLSDSCTTVYLKISEIKLIVLNGVCTESVQNQAHENM